MLLNPNLWPERETVQPSTQYLDPRPPTLSHETLNPNPTKGLGVKGFGGFRGLGFRGFRVWGFRVWGFWCLAIGGLGFGGIGV